MDTWTERDKLLWLAGLLEGEGYFGIVNCDYTLADGRRRTWIQIKIELNMTDLDVLMRAKEIMGAGTLIKLKKYKSTNTQAYGVRVQGRKEVLRLCERLYPFLGERRRAKIDQMRLVDNDQYKPVPMRIYD